MAQPGDGEDWDQQLRAISLSARDSSSSSDPSVDASLLKSVQILPKTCKNENSGDLIARVYPQMNRLFKRSLASPKIQSSENGLLLLTCRSLLEFMLAAFQQLPGFIAILKMELALQLCWAISEHGGGGTSHKDTSRELFESLELLLYENISSSRLGLGKDPTTSVEETIFGKSSQARLLCFVITAIAKLATCHRELLPRARVCLAKVARSRTLDMCVLRRARDYLGLMNAPGICLSVLGPVNGYGQKLGTVNWSEGGSKMVAHIPFYLLNEQEGPPFHDFSFTDVLPGQ